MGIFLVCGLWGVGFFFITCDIEGMHSDTWCLLDFQRH